MGHRTLRCPPQPLVGIDRVQVGEEQGDARAPVVEGALDSLPVSTRSPGEPSRAVHRLFEHPAVERFADEARVLQRRRPERGAVRFGEREAGGDVFHLPQPVVGRQAADPVGGELQR